MIEFLHQHQLLLWILTVFTDLGFEVQLAGAKYVFKFAIAVIDTPFIYLACRWKAGSHDGKEESTG